jgi:NIPSNAP
MLLASGPGVNSQLADNQIFTQEETTMRTFELRVYTLRTKEALDFYREVIYPRHLNSFPRFGIEAHGFWTAATDVKPRLFVLASYAAGEEPAEVARRYMQSKEFADDTRDFDVSSIVGVESTNLIPSPSSPLT